MWDQEILFKLIAKQFRIEDISSITLNMDFNKDLNADSLDVIELSMLIEEEFDIEISDKDLKCFKTVQSIVNYLNNKLI